jgi:hypothetical protein
MKIIKHPKEWVLDSSETAKYLSIQDYHIEREFFKEVFGAETGIMLHIPRGKIKRYKIKE